MAPSMARSRSNSNNDTSSFPVKDPSTITLPARKGSFTRRRKVSVPELNGPMTTVQELGVDSPTIPRNTLKKPNPDFKMSHERSSSAPGGDWRHCAFGDAMTACVPPATSTVKLPPSGTAERKILPGFTPSKLEPIFSPSNESRPALKVQTKGLQSATGRTPARSGSDDTPPEVPPKSPRMDSAHASSTSEWLQNATRSPPSARGPPSARSRAGGLEITTPVSAPIRPGLGGFYRSESSPMLLHGQPVGAEQSPGRGRALKRSKSFTKERKESEARREVHEVELPAGLCASDASLKMKMEEKEKLQRQAAGQAERFEVLCVKDVDSLSKELRALDERCEYLRRTYKSLLSNRRKLHARMMSYLRRDGTTIFSREGLIKQEEAIDALDSSLDDWVSKIEQADNRRMRVRQKLLEHIAATMLLPRLETAAATPAPPQRHQEATPPRSPVKENHTYCSTPAPSHSPAPVSPVRENYTHYHHASASPRAVSPLKETPPRSPVRDVAPLHIISSSPLMGRDFVESPVVVRHIVSPPATAAAAAASPATGRRGVESIKIYADGEILNLFANIERAIGDIFEPETPAQIDDGAGGELLQSRSY